jgi:hypothetical protein
MNVFYSDTVQNIRQRIHKADGTPMDRTQLKLDNKILQNAKTMMQIGAKEGSVIKLVYTSIKVKVELSSDETIEVSVDPTDTTLNLKEVVEDEKKIPAVKQILKFGSTILVDSKSLKEQGVHEGDKLVQETKITMKTIKIPKPTSGFYEIKIDIALTIKQLRAAIQQKYGLDMNKFKLKTASKELTDSLVIEESGCLEQTIILYYVRMNLVVTTADGQTVNVEINPFDKVISLRNMISGATQLPLNRFKLTKADGTKL